VSCGNTLPLSTAEYLGVPSGCYAGVMQKPARLEQLPRARNSDPRMAEGSPPSVVAVTRWDPASSPDPVFH
jgi:hypothetical protein